MVQREQVVRPRPHDTGSDEAAAAPHVDLPELPVAPRAAVLVLPGGKADSRAPVQPHQLTVRRMQPFAGALTDHRDDLAVGQVRYRYRGWNGDAADPVADVELALDAVTARYGPIPVVLLGHSMGGRAALRVGGRPEVRGVVALAPWLPGTEPVEQLAGRDLVVLHGTRDLTTSPVASASFVARAAPFTRRAVCQRVPWSGHGMLARASLWHRLTVEFVDAVVDYASFAAALDIARAARCRDCAQDANR